MYAYYQEQNEEKFNHEFIYNARHQDDICEYLTDISRALEVIEGIKFTGIEVITDEAEIMNSIRGNFRLKIEESRLQLIKIQFRITKGEEFEDIELKLFFPSLIDGFYYLIDGSRYFCTWQIVDRSTYVTSKTFSLKTLLMPIIFRTDKFIDVNATDGTVINGRLLILDVFKNRRNVLLYYFAKMGMSQTIEYFGFGDYIDVICSDESFEVDPKLYFTIKVGKGSMVICDKTIVGDPTANSFIISLVDAISSAKGITRNVADDPEQWLKKLGRLYTKNTNSQMEKAKRVMISLERILDDCTKKNLNEIPDEDKVDTYAILKYMILHYEELSKMDNMDLLNKRVRMAEYLVHPILIRFSDNTYRLLNNKTVTFKNLKSIFKNIKPGYIIKKLQTNKLLRYSNLVNDLDLFGCALKWSNI